jgi:alkaline phosphatase/alkaline phosphatase D
LLPTLYLFSEVPSVSIYQFIFVNVMLLPHMLLAQVAPRIDPIPRAAMGIMVGEVTDSSAITQLRLTATKGLVDRDVPGIAGVVEFYLQEANEASSDLQRIQVAAAAADHDFIARVEWRKLAANTEYACGTRIGFDATSLTPGPTARFKTLPGKDHTTAVRFVVVTGMNYAKFHGDSRIDSKQHLLENNRTLPKPYAGKDKHLGYPGLASILAVKPNFFVGTGDNVYYDTPDNPRAESLSELRQKWHEQFVQPRYVDLFARVPTYWEIDDHDYRIDDGDNSGDYLPSPSIGRSMMLEQLPIAPRRVAAPKTYRTHRVNRDLQIWLPENRMYRSDNAMRDGPRKTIWGRTQKNWLKRTLSASDAKYKLLISPTPMVGPDDSRKTDNHTNIGGFQHERDEFFGWLAKEKLIENGFYIVCGDRHWQYHSIHPSGVEEFSCGALVDANSRLGRKPGGPLSTDPDGTIRQVYAQKEPSGGFLMITVAPHEATSTLRFTYFDERGMILHEVQK